MEAQYARLEAADTAALGADLKRRRKREAIRGTAVAHQRSVWDRILEVRILLQRALTASHSLPASDGRQVCLQVRIVMALHLHAAALNGNDHYSMVGKA